MFEKHKKKIKKVVKQTMIDMSKHVSKKLTDGKVPVRTGHYVESHVVQTSRPSFPRSAIPKEPPYPEKLTGPASAHIRNPVRIKLKAAAKILIESGSTKIYFGNKAKYAHLVEFLGWTELSEKAHTGPYHVFNKAAGSLEMRKKTIATIAKKKVFK